MMSLSVYHLHSYVIKSKYFAACLFPINQGDSSRACIAGRYVAYNNMLSASVNLRKHQVKKQLSDRSFFSNHEPSISIQTRKHAIPPVWTRPSIPHICHIS